MKKIILSIVISIVIILLLASGAIAQELSFPQETAATGFWFISSDTYAFGISHTAVRLMFPQITNRISLDLDGTLAREINDNCDTVYGIGVKVNFFTPVERSTGFNFLPSVGLTGMNKLDDMDNIFDLKWAVYGTLIQYAW